MKNLSPSKSTFKNFKRFSKWISICVLAIILFLGFSQQVYGQATIQTNGSTAICEGGSTVINVKICEGYGPWTVVYTDGTSNYTVTNDSSNCDPDAGSLVGDPITVTPTITSTYTLVSVTFGSNLAVGTLEGSVEITVNPLPSNIIVTTSTPVCYGAECTISATAAPQAAG